MKALAEQISDIDGVNIYGRVVGVRGLMVEIAGPIHAMSVGARIVIETGGDRFIPAEVIGFSGNNAVLMPFAGLEGVRRGCRAVIANAAKRATPASSESSSREKGSSRRSAKTKPSDAPPRTESGAAAPAPRRATLV